MTYKPAMQPAFQQAESNLPLEAYALDPPTGDLFGPPSGDVM